MDRRKFISATGALSAMTALGSHSLLAENSQPDKPRQGSTTIQGIYHVGISTGDIDQSVNFYRDLIGMELLGMGEFKGKHYDNIFNLSNVRGMMAMLRINNLDIEVFEFENPKGKANDLKNPVNNHGFNHICFHVTDIQREYQRLKEAGVYFHCSPEEYFGRATYGRDPDGNVFELRQPPK